MQKWLNRGEKLEKVGTKIKKQQLKLKIQHKEINQKVIVKEGRLKWYQDRIKPYIQNRTFLNNEKKFYQQVGGDCTVTIQQREDKETKQFWNKIWEQREHNWEAEWISNMEKNG